MNERGRINHSRSASKSEKKGKNGKMLKGRGYEQQ
jgi:hypothetical protein